MRFFFFVPVVCLPTHSTGWFSFVLDISPVLISLPFTDELIIVDPATQATFRPKALLRTRALAYFLSGLRPLHLEHYTATPSKKGFPAVSAGGSRGLKASAASDAGNSDAGAANEDAPLLLATDDKKGSNSKAVNADGTASATKPEKRKYVFKNKPVKAPAAAAVAGTFTFFMFRFSA